MSKFYSILLLAVIAAPGIFRMGIIVDFSIHRDYIAEALCIKRDEPENSCQGCCQLKKQLSKTEAGTNDSEAPAKTKTINRFLDMFAMLNLSQNSDTGHKHNCLLHNFRINNLYFHTYIAEIFRPPRLIIFTF